MAATKLKIARIQKGITQWQLANQLGIGNTKLSMIETGRLKPTEDIKKKCSGILNVAVKDLFPENKR